MHDLRWIREHPEDFDAGLARRGLPAMAADVLARDERRRAALTEAQVLQAAKKKLSREIGQAKARGEDASALLANAGAGDERLMVVEAEADALATEITGLLAGIPNLPADDVPVGADESANVELRRSGQKPALDFPPQQHFEIGERLGLMDFETAARMSGSRFVVLSGGLARLERALAQFMLDLHTGEHGYREINAPLLVRENALFGTGQLPKFADQQFVTTDDRWLIPTAEVSLTNMVAEQIVPEDELPLRMTAYSPCFRSEAGAAGRDTRGMIRQHQFTKVEMVSIVRPAESEEELERMTACAEEVLKRLGLHYRVVVLSSGDMGFSARRTYDLEVWLPGQDMFREISSCSTCGDFQARRMNARLRPADGKGTQFVHTLNGSGVAVGRALVAVLETYQQADGSVRIPAVLEPYMGGVTRLEPAA
ncbi:MAG: serine--tRNA ligase [Alphaproteobacteria bacterium]